MKQNILTTSLFFAGISTAFAQAERPNIVLIMVDDMGYECLSSNGGLDYTTPNIDKLADQGIRFTQCYSQSLSTPTRTKIMTGMYNSTNYEFFGYLNASQRTFGNVMEDAGYKTCIVGKWQLNGLSINHPNADDSFRPRKMGFQEHCLWQLADSRDAGERYANPWIDTNGERKSHGIDVYGPDVFSGYGEDFIRRNKENPFFLYYPMALVHDPFYPTPDSKDWADKSLREKKNNKYFPDMVAYMDKIVGKIIETLKDEGVYDNTIVMFLTDNGTNRSIRSTTPSRVVQGAKGRTIQDGHRSPLVVMWPEKMAEGREYNHITSIADIFPTLVDLVNDKSKSEGVSLLPILKGSKKAVQYAICIHYDPQWGANINKFRAQYAMTTEYKLYATGEFFNYSEDIMEKKPIDNKNLNKEQRKVYKTLQKELSQLPKWDINGGHKPSTQELEEAFKTQRFE